MKVFRLLLVVLYIGLVSGCNDFFEEDSQSQAYVANLKDLDELLLGEAYINAEGFYYNFAVNNSFLINRTHTYFPWIHLLDDDIVEYAAGYNQFSDKWIRVNTRAAYGWDRNPFWNKDKNEYAPEDWIKTYKRIAVLNSILHEVNGFRKSDKDTLANRIVGEAYFLRAYYYYWLVNIYAQPYALNSAKDEMGVPLKLSEVVEDKYFERNSVQEVYDQIRKDLTNSMNALRDVARPVRPIRANYAAACLLMSRVCLYMEDYEGAIAYADSVIQRGEYDILDLNVLSKGASFTYEDSPETIFTQGGYIVSQIHTGDSLDSWNNPVDYSVASAYASSVDLLNTYSEYDLRKDIFFLPAKYESSNIRCIKFRDKSGRIGDFMLFRFPELLLNKAEAQAVLGDEAGAKATLTLLRERRFRKNEIPSIEEEMALTGERNLVSFIRNERRREFCYEGQRWFDLRRYAVNSRYPYSKTIRHDHYEWQGDENGTYVKVGYYELKPYAEDKAAYVFPLPADEIVFNKGYLVQNEIRPDRMFISY